MSANDLGQKFGFLFGKRQLKARIVYIKGSECANERSKQRFPANIVRNQKYNLITFLPIVLFNQFKFFLNLFFLLMSCSQFIPVLKVGYLYTYWAPLGFVMGVTLLREAIDDLWRFQRDKKVNSQRYQKLTKTGPKDIPSSRIKVGDLIVVSKDQRVPADMIFLRTSEKNGACFVRTDQLDGETDWKLRLAVSATQELQSDEQLFSIDAYVDAEKPQKDIHSFTGRFAIESVIASGTAIGIVIYTGPETRSMMNNNEPRSKVGLLDYEVRTTTIPEDLGRIAYLLTDKTGTLTKNEMVFKKIHLGKISYSPEYFDELAVLLRACYTPEPSAEEAEAMDYRKHKRQVSVMSTTSFTVERRQYQLNNMRLESYEVDKDSAYRAQKAVLAIALCHNVTPSYDYDQSFNPDSMTTSAPDSIGSSKPPIGSFLLIFDTVIMDH
ncbi:unnamed protein product [Sphagnum tenellum]